MKQDLLELEGKKIKRTKDGLTYGSKMIRAYYLNELSISEHSRYGEEEWHLNAHVAEPFID